GRQLNQTRLYMGIAGLFRLITKSSAAYARQLAGPSITQPMAIHQTGGTKLASYGRHHFFDKTSFMASTSSSLSASSFFNLLFWDSNSRNLLASLASMPAYMLRQL